MDQAARIKDAANIVDIVGEVVELRRSGSGLMGRCPFHNEKTGSFHVSPDKRRFKCFGCGEGGDVLDFVQKFHGLEFMDALRLLADRYGITLEDQKGDDQYRNRTRLRALYAAMQESYARALPGSSAAAYLIRRGLTLQVAEEFGIGFAADQLPRDVKPQQGDGILAKSGRVLIRSRLTVPIYDSTGNVIAFAGRALSDLQEPKYLNSPQTPIYSKKATLYNMHRAGPAGRRARRIVITEGYFDVIASHRAGIPETVAVCGTAFTPEHAKLLMRQVRQVVLVFDNDEAGRKATEKAATPLLSAGIEIKVCELPEGQDIDDLCRNDADGYRAMVDKAPDFWTHLLHRLGQEYALRSPSGSNKAIERLRPFAAAVSPVERSTLAAELSTLTGASQQLIEAALRGRRAPQSDPSRNSDAECLPAEATLVRLFADEPEALTLLEDARRVFEGLGLRMSSAVSILADHPEVEYGEWEMRCGEAAGDLAALVMAEGPRPSIADGKAALRALERELLRRRRREALAAAQSADDGAALDALIEIASKA